VRLYAQAEGCVVHDPGKDLRMASQ